MAVKSWDVLDQTHIFEDVASAVAGFDLVVATTARRGVSGVWTPRRLAPAVVERAARNERTVVLFGNEKTGLGEAETALASEALRIPMAADQPSVNLAQAVQIVAYELLVAALEQREQSA
jgi:tRNA C32,U32 (ribose-2'-O)-methylase TrmJ